MQDPAEVFFFSDKFTLFCESSTLTLGIREVAAIVCGTSATVGPVDELPIVCGGSGIEQASKPEPSHDAASHRLGEGR